MVELVMKYSNTLCAATLALAAAGAHAEPREVPAGLMSKVERSLAKLTGSTTGSNRVVRTRHTQWPNGALGCPIPGMVYTQAPVDGYQIVLEHEGREYDFRSKGEAYVMLCLAPSDLPPSSGPPTQ